MMITAAAVPAPVSVPASWLPDIRRSRDCTRWFLIIAVPAVLALCFLIGPLQGLDEASHFYRSVQLSEGHILPVRSPAADAAGDDLDVSIAKIGGYYADLSYKHWRQSFGSGPADLAAASSTTLSGTRQFTRFSNTVIYFPLAHIVPALAIAVVKRFDNHPMTWIYAGRVLNAVVALAIIVLAIGYFDTGRAFVFVLALLPRTLFSLAALSPDALLIPLAMLFAALVYRLATRERLTWLEHALLFVSGLFICTSKLAYVPMAIIPPVIAMLADRRLSRQVSILTISAVVIVVVWLMWMSLISSSVYPIRHNAHIDIYGQLRWVLAHPLGDLMVLRNSFAQTGFGYFNTMVGGDLGSSEAQLPKWLSGINFAVLAWSAVSTVERTRGRLLELAFVTLVATGVSIGIFLLLYMQYTEVGHYMVDGVQGRYFLPLLPILVAFLPKLQLSPDRARLLSTAAVLWMTFVASDTVYLLGARYLGATAQPGVSFARFTHTDVE